MTVMLRRSMAPASADLEQAWRPMIPVESFTKQPATVTPPPPPPSVGIRWGKPSEFDYALEDAKQKKHGTGLIIKETPRRYFENNIIDFTEQYRQFKAGRVKVQVDKPSANEDWEAYLNSIQTAAPPESLPEVEIEETQHWIFDSGYAYDDYNSAGEVIRTTQVYYKFKMERYIPFKSEPPAKIDERGEKP